MRRSFLLCVCLAALFVTSSWALTCYKCTERQHGQQCLEPKPSDNLSTTNCYGGCITRKEFNGKIERSCRPDLDQFRYYNNSVPVGTCGKFDTGRDGPLPTCMCAEDLCNGLADPFPTPAPSTIGLPSTAAPSTVGLPSTPAPSTIGLPPTSASNGGESSGGGESAGEVSESGAMTIVKSSGFLVVAGLWAALVRLGQ